MNRIPQAGQGMHYLFEVTAKPGYTIEQYAEAWVKASELIQQAPGAQGTRLHRKIGDERTALAIATWESKAARDASGALLPQEVQHIIQAEAPFVTIHFIGEFESPDWEVLPPG
ncbi:antibiotic biosynthesis monooxygenase [Luminiphilus sp.]|jgi:heme-degrading monooxygenase HmoA|nr:antibiotic biosynthesis monooxygenase [Luminiphilus sp.]